MPLGQEDSLRPWLLVFRQLPADGFKTSPASQQPLVVRTRTSSTDTYVYAVNESPWPVRAVLRLTATAGCTLLDLGSGVRAKPLEGGQWTVALQPYGLAAARFSKPGVRVDKVELEAGVAPAPNSRLASEIWTAGHCSPVRRRLPVLARTRIRIATHQRRGGRRLVNGDALLSRNAARFRKPPRRRQFGCDWQRCGVATLTSDLFPAPKTGRVAPWVRPAH